MIERENVAKHLKATIKILPEDIARAKDFVLHHESCHTLGLSEQWLKEQQFEIPIMINDEGEDAEAILARVAGAYSLRFALFTAVWQLINAGELVPIDSATMWEADLGFRTSRMSGGYPNMSIIKFPYQASFHRIDNSVVSLDSDIFLRGLNCATLHSGIHEAIRQSLQCFQRNLYLPATAMLAAAAEATWTECGLAIAKRLNNSKLQSTIDSEAGIGKKVADIRKVLESQGTDIINAANRKLVNVAEAEQWTMILRDRRNALHWGKANNFVADHSTTAVLLMAAPMHLTTLEAIRVQC